MGKSFPKNWIPVSAIHTPDRFAIVLEVKRGKETGNRQLVD
jgi:hypothetical protein